MDKVVESVSREVAEAYGDVARAVCHIPETEPVVIFTIAGQRNEDCGRACEGCLRYSECFPPISRQQQAMWEGILSQLLEGGEK